MHVIIKSYGVSCNKELQVKHRGHAKDDHTSQHHTTMFNKICLLVQKRGK